MEYFKENRGVNQQPWRFMRKSWCGTGNCSSRRRRHIRSRNRRIQRGGKAA